MLQPHKIIVRLLTETNEQTIAFFLGPNKDYNPNSRSSSRQATVEAAQFPRCVIATYDPQCADKYPWPKSECYSYPRPAKIVNDYPRPKSNLNVTQDPVVCSQLPQAQELA